VTLQRRDLPEHKVLQALRPCRESITGWTPAAWRWAPVNQNSYKLNEHGPALNVFWSCSSGMGAGRGASGFGPSAGG